MSNSSIVLNQFLDGIDDDTPTLAPQCPACREPIVIKEYDYRAEAVCGCELLQQFEIDVESHE